MTQIDLINDSVAQELLHSPTPARLAYNWRDGTPRVVPIWFHWTGTEVVMGTPPKAPKLRVLKSGSPVAVTIDSTTWPYHALMLRGTVTVEAVDGVVPEYAAAAERYLGPEQGRAWVEQLKGMQLGGMTRIALSPTYAAILDFEERFPSALTA